jgi:hypothetical protein
VPIVGGSGEIKTKPTQHSVKELRGIGIQPDVLLCRCKNPLPDEQRRKIALFTNVEERAVISGIDADDIYKIPMLLHEQGLDEIVVDKLRLNVPPADLTEWKQVVAAKANPDGQVDIAMVGKYVQVKDSYISLNEALTHAGVKTRTRVNVHYIESTDIEKHGTHALSGMDAILVPGGFGERGIEGKIAAVRWARENKIPYLGICLGMQLRCIEFGRHVLGLENANSTEFNRASPHPVIALITEWQDARRASRSATTRPARAAPCASAAQEVRVTPNTLARPSTATRRSRASSPSLRIQQQLPRSLHAAGFRFSGLSKDDLVEIIELPGTRGSSPRSSTRSSPRRRVTGIRCSRASCAPRASIATHSCPKRRAPDPCAPHHAGWCRIAGRALRRLAGLGRGADLAANEGGDDPAHRHAGEAAQSPGRPRDAWQGADVADRSAGCLGEPLRRLSRHPGPRQGPGWRTGAAAALRGSEVHSRTPGQVERRSSRAPRRHRRRAARLRGAEKPRIRSWSNAPMEALVKLQADQKLPEHVSKAMAKCNAAQVNW